MAVFPIFSGFSRTLDVVEFTDTAIPVVKRLFVRSADFLEQLGSFYLLYALYFKQPPKEFTKIRVRQADWVTLKTFYEKISQSEEYIQAKMIFWKLMKVNAFNFVATDEEFGFDTYLSHAESDTLSDSEMKKIEGSVKEDLMNFVKERNGIVSAIQLIEMGYNEMKEGLKNPKNDKLLPASSCATEVLLGLRKINEIFNPEPAIEVVSGDSRRKSLKKKAFQGNESPEKAPDEVPGKKGRTTMWRKMVQVNNQYLEVTTPYRDTQRKNQSFTKKILDQSMEGGDCDDDQEETEFEDDFSEGEVKILPEID